MALFCVVFSLFVFNIHLAFSETGSILEISNPSVILRASEDGNFTIKPGQNGNLYIQPGSEGTVMYRDMDLLHFLQTLRSLPPVWETPSAVGFAGGYTGGDVVNVTLKAKDPEAGEITYALVAGSLPPGIVLARGVIRGFAPDENAIFVATIRATDIHRKYADAIFRFQIKDNNRCLTTHPCRNGAACVDKKDTYLCNCVGVYGGKNCEKVCNQSSLGVDNSTVIPDARMSAYRGRVNSSPTDARMSGIGWCGMSLPWLQIDLGARKRIERVVTAGRTTKYEMSYSTDGDSFTYYSGDTHSLAPLTVSERDYQLPVTMHARFIRFWPTVYSGMACLKVDLFGCDMYE